MVKSSPKIGLKEEGQVFWEGDKSSWGHHMIEGTVGYLVEMPVEETEV